MNKTKNHILYIDDEKENLTGFKYVFKQFYQVHIASSAVEGWDILKKEEIKVVITDQRMPKITGVQLLEKTAVEYPNIYRIILTGYTDVQDIIEAINKGKIFQFIRKPWDKDEVKVIIDNAIKLYDLKKENDQLLNILQEKNIELENINSTLEKKVKERTKEIEEKNAELKRHRNHLEELVKIRTIDLEKAKIRAEESDKLKSSFLANVSHEIRTPMNAIIGFSELLVNNDYTIEEQREFKNHIVINAGTLLRLIDDILDISKIEADQIKIQYKNCNLNQLLDELYVIYEKEKFNMGKGHIDLFYEIQTRKNIFISTDRIRLHQVLSNLISNALKFTESGYVKFGFNIINENTEKPEIKFYIKDSGIGIPVEAQQYIFDRFRKADITESKFYSGAGLGLFICKSLVDMFNGKIWIESEKNKGSSFYFQIPYLPVEDFSLNELVEDIKQDISDYCFKNKLILVAEDEDSNYLFIEEVLKTTQADVIRAKDGKESVELFRTTKNIDLVLMDIQMPVMSGYEAIHQIKQMNRNVPIIAQTAYALTNQREEILNTGCDFFIPKPFRPEELLKTINKFL